MYDHHCSFVPTSVEDGHSGRIHHGHLRTALFSLETAYGNVLTPIVYAKAKRPGDVLLLLGGVYGDDVDGSIAINRIMGELSTEDLQSGAIVFVPYLNVGAIAKGLRLNPHDMVDMNQCWPGCKDGTPSQRIVHAITSNLVKQYGVTHVVDIQGGGSTFEYSEPMVAYHNHDLNFEAHEYLCPVRKRIDLAMRMTAHRRVLVLNNCDSEQSLAEHFHSRGIHHCRLITTTQSPSHTKTQTKALRDSIHNCLVSLEILKPIKRVNGPHIGKPNLCYIPKGPVLSMHHGLLEFTKKPGDKVMTDTVLGFLHPYNDPLKVGSQEGCITLRAPYEGTIIGMSKQTIVQPGDTLVALASGMAYRH